MCQVVIQIICHNTFHAHFFITSFAGNTKGSTKGSAGRLLLKVVCNGKSPMHITVYICLFGHTMHKATHFIIINYYHGEL